MTDDILNKEQAACITHDKGQLLIIAGAGTGKTTVITERITHLILQKHINPSCILALTFTEKAAAEMEERVDIAMPLGYSRIWIETFHGFCDRILRQEALHIGLTPNYKMLTETESVSFMKKHIFSLQLDYFKPLGNPNKFIQSLLQHFSRLQDEDISPEEYMTYAKKMSQQKPNPDEKEAWEEEIKKTQELANAYDMYTKLKQKEGVMDFGDLITNTLLLFRKRKNVLLSYQKQFEYILIDEFQDTNFAQNQLAILLAGKEQNITVVGDDDQAIYRWRGAATSNMIQFKTHFPTAKIITLNTNYRSTQTILDGAYTLIQQNNPDRLEVKEKISKKLIAANGKKGKEIGFIVTERGEQEVEEVMKSIYEIIKKNRLSYNDIAILVRANDHAKPFMHAFDREKIPYQFLGPGNLFHQEIIKDLIAYCKVLCNFEDTSSLYRILTMPIFDMHQTTIATLLNTAKKRTLSVFELMADLSTVRIPNDEKEKLTQLHTMITHHLGKIAKESAGHILYTFLQESRMLQKLIESQDVHDQENIQAIATFFDKLKSYENTHDDTSVFAVVDWIDLSMDMGESPLMKSDEISNNNAINILTVHGSKGLEFPVVFLVNLIRDRFPSKERKELIPIPQELIKEVLPEGDYHLEEERRLFYVAMTRAKETLFFSAAKFYGEGKRERKLSPFIAETMGLETVEKIVNKKTINQLSLLDLYQKPPEQDNTAAINHKPYTISYLSYSQIQTFDICPLHYKLRYILKIPTPQTASQSFGTSIHAVLRDYYQNIMIGNKLSDQQVDDLLKINWIREGYENAKHEKESFAKAHDVLRLYLDKHKNIQTKPAALEIPFEFPLQGIRIGGRIDRIDELSDGRIEIIDYKTGSNTPTEKEVAKNLQLTTYALAATVMSNPLLQKSPDKIILSLDYVEANKKFSTTRTQEELEIAKTYLLEKSKEIAASDFLCSKSIFCQRCEYAMLCNVKIPRK